jgi:hypothetical protein
MEEQDENDNRKVAITQYFLNALEYLIDSGRLKSVADFERKTGYRQQRITGMKKSMSDILEDPDGKSKRYYANTDHLEALFVHFNVSPAYLLTGQKPIVIEEEKKQPSSDLDQKVNFLEKRLFLVEETCKLLNERMKYFSEKGAF